MDIVFNGWDVCVSYLGRTWHQKLPRWWRHCNALENLASRHPQDFCKLCSAFMETIFPDVRGRFQPDEGTCHKVPMVQESGLRSTTTVGGVDSPALNPTSICVRNVLDKKVWHDWSSTPCWCQIPQQTFRGLRESMTQRVQAVRTAKGGPTQYSDAGNNVWPILRLICDTIWNCVVMIINVYKYIFHQHVPIGTVCLDLSAPLLPGLTLDLHII